MTEPENTVQQPLATEPENQAKIDTLETLEPMESLPMLKCETSPMSLANPDYDAELEKKHLYLIKDKFNPEKYNPVLLSQSIIDALPAGIQLAPVVVSIPDHERWDREKAKFLSPGVVMPSATAIKRIGKAAGVQLERVTDELIKINGKDHLRIEYRASLMMPDGTIISEIGGKEEPYVSGQHSREKTDTKAKRNAVRALLDIPLTLPEAGMNKPFVVFKPIFHKGQSEYTDRIIARMEGEAENAKAQLYGSAVQQTIDVEATTSEPEGEATFSDLKQALESCRGLEALEAVGSSIRDARLTGEERDILASVYKVKAHELKGGVN